MTPISKEAALKFCELCNWAYEVWVTHKFLFDENKNPEANIGKSKYFTSRLSIITQEYGLLQVAKLHDPAILRSSINLTIEYLVRFGDWGSKEMAIKKLESNLSDLWQYLKLARNKALAHHDLLTLMKNDTLGAFPQGTDDKYFEVLQAFVNEVHEKWIGGPYPFNDLAIVDVQEFIDLIQRC